MSALLLIALLQATPDAGAERLQTVAVMHSAMHAMVSLQPYVASPEVFRDPANKEAIATSLLLLTKVKHRFAAPGRQDPATEALAGLFGGHVERARGEFTSGDTEAARAHLRSISALCFACHTRDAVPKDFDDAGKRVEALSLPPLRKAEFFATTRQFDRAAAAWNVGLAVAPKLEADWFEQASALRQYVAVLVRVKDDRQATLAMLTRQAARKDLPLFFHRTLEQWRLEAREWSDDPFVAGTATAAALFAKAKAMVEASGLAKRALSDEGRFVSMLRATGYLHAALEKEPRAIWRGEALYLLGVATAATLDPLLWELDSLYLEACVREKPHSAIARHCVERMYDRAWFAWSGSGGTNIPTDVAQLLGELRQLAK